MKKSLFIKRELRPQIYSSKSSSTLYGTFSGKEGGSDGKEGGSDGSEGGGGGFYLQNLTGVSTLKQLHV